MRISEKDTTIVSLQSQIKQRDARIDELEAQINLLHRRPITSRTRLEETSSSAAATPPRYPSPDRTVSSISGFSSDTSSSTPASPPKPFQPRMIPTAPPPHLLTSIADTALRTAAAAQERMKPYSATGHEHLGYYVAHPDGPYDPHSERVPLVHLDPFLNNYRCRDVLTVYARATPSLRDLEARHGPRWRAGRFHFFYRFGALARAIEAEVERYIPLEVKNAPEGVVEEEDKEGRAWREVLERAFCDALDEAGSTFSLASGVMGDARYLEKVLEFDKEANRFVAKRGMAPSPKRVRRIR
ncbi:hypothetical protein BC830DRAFT_1170971 [Chytriomyces sp. MP71]|nr:hypothetical protein BC830DRAFT_1170971 [Chytriomyces sp. MP71]